MSSTKQLLQSASSVSEAKVAIAQALDPKFPWEKAVIARVGNAFVKKAMGMEATLTLPKQGKTQKTPPKFKGKAARKVKPAAKMSNWLKQQLAEAEELVQALVQYTTHKVTIEEGNVLLEGFVASLGDPTVGPKGGVRVMLTLKAKGKSTPRTYEVSGKQAQRLFEGGNCGTTVGHILHTA